MDRVRLQKAAQEELVDYDLAVLATVCEKGIKNGEEVRCGDSIFLRKAGCLAQWERLCSVNAAPEDWYYMLTSQSKFLAKHLLKPGVTPANVNHSWTPENILRALQDMEDRGIPITCATLREKYGTGFYQTLNNRTQGQLSWWKQLVVGKRGDGRGRGRKNTLMELLANVQAFLDEYAPDSNILPLEKEFRDNGAGNLFNEMLGRLSPDNTRARELVTFWAWATGRNPHPRQQNKLYQMGCSTWQDALVTATWRCCRW